MNALAQVAHVHNCIVYLPTLNNGIVRSILNHEKTYKCLCAVHTYKRNNTVKLCAKEN